MDPPFPAGGLAHSFDEFTQLREVIVGNPSDAKIPDTRDVSVWLNLYGDMRQDELQAVQTGRYPKRVIEETAEDLAMLIQTFEDIGIAVHQALPFDPELQFASPHWISDGFYSYCPRDLALVVGTMIIETPSPMRARYFETFSIRPVLQRCMRAGSPWISAPKPELRDELFWVDKQGLPRLGELEPVFEAANVLRCGRDIFYQVSSSGNELGMRWLDNVLQLYGDFTLRPLRGIYDLTHIDSSIAILRPGLVLLNPERVNEANLPESFSRWDILWCPPMADPPTAIRHPLSSRWIGMNLLMVSPELAIVDRRQRALIQELERRAITVLPHSLRHSRVLGGGFHCVTLDLVRDGGPQNYFD